MLDYLIRRRYRDVHLARGSRYVARLFAAIDEDVAREVRLPEWARANNSGIVPDDVSRCQSRELELSQAVYAVDFQAAVLDGTKYKLLTDVTFSAKLIKGQMTVKGETEAGSMGVQLLGLPQLRPAGGLDGRGPRLAYVCKESDWNLVKEVLGDHVVENTPFRPLEKAVILERISIW